MVLDLKTQVELMMKEILKKIKEAIIELDSDIICELVQKALDDGIPPSEILDAGTSGMEEVGRLYEEKEYYLTELILAGDTMKKALEILKPALKQQKEIKNKEPIVIATVKGDQHDIGKNILISLLVAKGYEIHDLGTDVDAAAIVEKVKETGAKLVALSTLLTITTEQIKHVHDALVKAGIRSNVKLIVGGAPLNIKMAKELGADSYAEDAMSGVKEIERLISN
ncbi:MAG: cobalamin B12-binding domain-containing protein [Promethearchaeota archaeon]